MQVAELMSRAVITVTRDTLVQNVTRLLARRGISGVPVLNADGTVAGIVTEEDLIVRHANPHLPLYLNVLDGFFPFMGEHQFQEEVRHMLATRAEELMNPKPVVIPPSMEVESAAALMVDTHTSPVLVVEGGVLVGILSRSDIIRLMVLEERQAEETEKQ
jgi:CBS domain-containing protein